MNSLDGINYYEFRLQIVSLYKYVLQIGFAVYIAYRIILFYSFGPETDLFLTFFA